jgi:NAD-dependent deacetylase
MSRHIVVFSGSGVSAESGISTFRDPDGMWAKYDVEEVATPQAFARNPGKVLDFYNLRRRNALAAQPNAAHIAIARLQKYFDVTVITQNVDDLHERAGSTNVLHLHGELMKSRSTLDEALIYENHGNDIRLGDKCEQGSQLRPHIVWFGEAVPKFDAACDIATTADILLVVGTSLAVYPAASLVDHVHSRCDVYAVDPALSKTQARWNYIRDTAARGVPQLVEQWINSLS